MAVAVAANVSGPVYSDRISCSTTDGAVAVAVLSAAAACVCALPLPHSAFRNEQRRRRSAEAKGAAVGEYDAGRPHDHVLNADKLRDKETDTCKTQQQQNRIETRVKTAIEQTERE